MLKQILLIFSLLLLSFSASAQTSLTYEQQLGRLLFLDKNLSVNKNQACASCHSFDEVFDKTSGTKLAPAFVDSQNVRKGTPVSLGSIPFATGSLNAPSVAYAASSPPFHWDNDEGLYVGGQFWNGRANDLAQQAEKPFLNPVEMAMPSKWAVVSRLKESPDYKNLFWKIYKINLNTVPHIKNGLFTEQTPKEVDEIYSRMAEAIAEFEKSRSFNKYNSKFDYVLAGKTQFSPIEKQGLALFNGKAGCNACHISAAETDKDSKIIPPLFTDFTYDNIGLPRNIKIPGNPPANLGLGGRNEVRKLDKNREEVGKHKVMTLRNIAITPPYGHNGVLATLEQVVHFYNTRDTLSVVTDNTSPEFGVSGWPAPEVNKNVNHDELGNLGLTAEEELAVVAFMKTLTDDYPVWGNDPNVPLGTPSPFKISVK